MGRLTGPSNEPRERELPQTNPNDVTNKGEGETENAETAPPLNPSDNNAKSSNPNPNVRISFRNRRGQQNPKIGIHSSNNTELSNSMITAVNNAAKTAELVLGKAAAGEMDDNRSTASHGSLRSMSGNSVHSFGSSRRLSGDGLMGDGGRPLRDDRNMYQIPLADSALDAGVESSLNDTERAAEAEGGTASCGDGSFLRSGDSSILRSDNSSEMGGAPAAAFSPPAQAFKNLPMRRSYNAGGNRNDPLAEGKVFEVTNHYDAAAAISAALSSSYLAQAAGKVGELQMPKQIQQPPRQFTRRKTAESQSFTRDRTFSFGDDSVDLSPTQHRRSQSGGVSSFIEAMQDLQMPNTQDDDHKTTGQTLEDIYVPTRGGSRKRDGSPSRRASGGLPTPDEAKAEMMAHRDTWSSADDLSLGSDDDKVLKIMKSRSCDRESIIREGKQPSVGVGKENETWAVTSAKAKGNEQIVNANSQEGDKQATATAAATGRNKPKFVVDRAGSPSRRAGRLPSQKEAESKMLLNRTSFVSVDDLSFGSDQDHMRAALKKITKEVRQLAGDKCAESETDRKGGLGEVGEETRPTDEEEAAKRNNRTRIKSDDSASNESNTSSVYGSNTNSGYSSDVSPISMSTGGTGEDKKNGTDGNGGNAGGMLGNLASSRRAAIAAGADRGCDGADDEYSTHSENSGKPHAPLTRKRPGNEDGTANSVADSAGPMSSINLGPSRPGVAIHAVERAVGPAKDDVPPAERVRAEPKKETSVPDAAPAHRVSMFDSFDRNWEQAVRGSEDPERAFELGRKCFACFAVVFGPCEDADGRSAFGDKFSSFSWWDDGAGGGSAAGGEGAAAAATIPAAVVRALWKTCFPGEADDDDVLDSIQRTLAEELCYLAAGGGASSSSSPPCVRLSLDVYAEYGWYILRRFGMQDGIAKWHAMFAGELRRMLLDDGLVDADSMILRRYAARSLPRHTAIGLLDVDSNGHFQMDLTEDKCIELRDHMFQNLLCDEDFVNHRAKLLGRGIVRTGDVSYGGGVDKALIAGGANPQIAKLIEQARGNDNNMLYTTMAHMKDIEWCASFCVADQKESSGEEKGEGGCSSFSNCLSAMTKWKEALIASFCTLHDGGKLTIVNGTAKGKSLPGEEDLGAQLAQLESCYDEADNGQSPGAPESCMEVAKSLLSIEDAWTMKDDSTRVFQEGNSNDFSSPRPPRKRRQKRNDTREAPAFATSLARVLNADINDLRTVVSVGRSLLGLVEFSQYILDKEIFTHEDPDVVTSSFQQLKSSCLKNAIEVLSCSATTLGYILSSFLDQLDEDDLDETVIMKKAHSGKSSVANRKKSLGPAALLQLFAMTREESKPLLSIAGILSADAWFSFGKLVGELDVNSPLMLSSFERALLILNSPKSVSLNKPALDLLCESLLSPLTQYKYYLQSNINHSVGVCLYEQGDFDRAADYLDKASRFRRQMLDDLRGKDGESDDHGSGLSKLFNAVAGGMKGNHLLSPVSMSEELFTDVFKYSIGHGCKQLPRETFEVDELERCLSLTLEYSALTQHAGQKYQMALSFFQEALILRTMHVGKHSLDVASLHFNMGVVYDDLEQHDQAISRYHESLRIRLDQMSKATSPKFISELEDSVLLTLKCLGHVYKLTHDMDNAICCYVKAWEMVSKKFAVHQDYADEWSKMGLRLGLAVPVPTVIFDEMKASTDNENWKTHFQMMNKKELCHVFVEPKPVKPRRSRSAASKLKRELVRIHSTVMDLVHERKQSNWDGESGSTRNKLPGSSSLLLASLSSTFKTGGDAFEAALMRSSFCLGRMRLEQMRYEEAADYLETALRSKWVLDPASSSDSDSDYSLKSMSSRKQQAKVMDEDNPEEGQIYYSLGICNAALDDHERAVRCFLTAMRYLRRSLRRVDSLEVARVLFDCATSHYYLCNFEQSVSLYEECLRILKSYDIDPDEEAAPSPKDGSKTPAPKEVAKSNSFRRGIVLYCLVMAKAAIDFDAEASNLLNEAQMLLSSCGDQVILAYMEFLTGLFLHHAASQVPIRLRSITRISSTGISLNDGLSWNEMCQSALTLLEQVKNECWFDPLQEVEDSDEVRHLPLSGHICFTKGQVYELIDSVDQALNSYVDAANFYRIACGDENMYVASVLHRMGMICSLRTEYHALGYFNEALTIRKNILGGNDHLVAETLYSSAIVLARLNRYEASMERYHEALRIQMSDSQDSNEVARTLAGMGICHYNHRAYDLALTCLEGAVKIRKFRVARLTNSAELVELYGEECALGADFFNLGNIHMQMEDYAQAMQCFIQSRDLRWCHVGSGTVTKILDKYFSETTVDEDELLGLAHCLHNIGVMFDIKKEYVRSLPHYEEALAIKNAIAGFSAKDSLSVVDQVNQEQNEALVLQSLHKDHEFPRINKATLSASVTRQKIAMVYVKQRKYDHALFHFSHALRIQRQVLGKDHFRVGSILSSMGNALRRTSTPSETAIVCYNESLRISRLRFGQNHTTVASALFDIGNLHDSNQNFNKAMHYYQRALSVYRQKYTKELRQRLCSGLDRPRALANGVEGGTEILSTGDEIIVAGDASSPEKQIRDQYVLVTEALRRAKRQDRAIQGETRTCCVGDSSDAWMAFEVLLFRFVEMLSTYVVDPAQTVVREAIDNSRRRIESAAGHAVISAKDALDYQFLLLMQD